VDALCGPAIDWYGWFAGVVGIVGSLLLVKPLFLLLRHREGVEMLVHAMAGGTLDAERQAAFDAAKTHLETSIFAGRHRWKSWAYAGIVALVLALLAGLAQGGCLLVRSAAHADDRPAIVAVPG
jgi:hypothetical protein